MAAVMYGCVICPQHTCSDVVPDTIKPSSIARTSPNTKQEQDSFQREEKRYSVIRSASQAKEEEEKTKKNKTYRSKSK